MSGLSALSGIVQLKICVFGDTENICELRAGGCRAGVAAVPRQTWLCSSACRRDRSPSSHYGGTRKERKEAACETRTDTTCQA